MRNKKEIPLVVLKALEPYVNLKGEKFEILDPKDHLLKAIDKDLSSNFHFTIEKYQKAQNRSFLLWITQSPKNEQDNRDYQYCVEISGLSVKFEAWLELLAGFDAVNSFFDDPIIKSFQEEYYAEFEIIDDDAETRPFETKKILLLDEYLEDADNKLTEFRNEQNAIYVDDIQLDIILLRESLTTRSKKWVVTRFSYICAKIAKQGTKFIKELLSEAKKEGLKQGIKALIEIAIEAGK